MVDVGPSPRTDIQIDDDILKIISEVWDKYGHYSNAKLKTAVYNTEPMRFILRQENKGKDMRNRPVLYKDKAAADIA